MSLCYNSQRRKVCFSLAISGSVFGAQVGKKIVFTEFRVRQFTSIQDKLNMVVLGGVETSN
jgi:hypothetical protein